MKKEKKEEEDEERISRRRRQRKQRRRRRRWRKKRKRRRRRKKISRRRRRRKKRRRRRWRKKRRRRRRRRRRVYTSSLFLTVSLLHVEVMGGFHNGDAHFVEIYSASQRLCLYLLTTRGQKPKQNKKVFIYISLGWVFFVVFLIKLALVMSEMTKSDKNAMQHLCCPPKLPINITSTWSDDISDIRFWNIALDLNSQAHYQSDYNSFFLKHWITILSISLFSWMTPAVLQSTEFHLLMKKSDLWDFASNKHWQTQRPGNQVIILFYFFSPKQTETEKVVMAGVWDISHRASDRKIRHLKL